MKTEIKLTTYAVVETTFGEEAVPFDLVGTSEASDYAGHCYGTPLDVEIHFGYGVEFEEDGHVTWTYCDDEGTARKVANDE